MWIWNKRYKIMEFLKYFENIVGEIPIDNMLGYLDRMSYGAIDKLFFVDKIDFDCIVDFGAADGIILEKLKEIKPTVNTVAYEIDGELLQLLKSKDIDLVTNSMKEIQNYIKNFKSPILFLSSVIHEIYSYSSQREIVHFWNVIFNSGFKYIVIRDMSYDRSFRTFNLPYEDIDKVYNKSKDKLIEDFERNWGSIKTDYRTLLHYLLKYRYEDNWTREVKENYLPISLEKLKEKIPPDWNISYEEYFLLDYIRKTIKEDFDVNITEPTHIKMIIENKSLNESVDNSKSKMKHIVDDLLTKSVGGNEYFNKIDSSIKLYKNIDMIQNVFDYIKKEQKNNFNLILTGGFGDWVLSMIKKGKLTIPKNLVLVNGSIRGKGNKLNKLTTGKQVDIVFKKDEIENQEFILFDDSYYSGSTKKAIDRFLKKYNSRIKQTFVLYDGNDNTDKSRKSLYRYYDYHKGTQISIKKLLDYLHDNSGDVPTDEIENRIVKGQLLTIRQINVELNKVRINFNRKPIDINNINRNDELKYDGLSNFFKKEKDINKRIVNRKPRYYKKRTVKLNENFDFNEDDFDYEEEFDQLGEEIKVIYDDLFEPDVFYTKVLKIVNDKKVVISYSGYLCYAIFKGKNWWVGDEDFDEDEQFTEEMIITTYIAEYGDKLVSIKDRLEFAGKMREVSDFTKIKIYNIIKNHYRTFNEGFLFKKDNKDKKIVYYTQTTIYDDKVNGIMKVITPEWIRNNPVAFEVFNDKLYLTEGHHRFEASRRLDDKDIIKSLFDSALYYNVNKKPRHYKKRTVKLNEDIDWDDVDDEEEDVNDENDIRTE